jgi:hypothetical protein
MVCKVGNDFFGEEMRRNFIAHHVNNEFIFTTDKASSGVALISVADDGSHSLSLFQILIFSHSHLILVFTIQYCFVVVVVNVVVDRSNSIVIVSGANDLLTKIFIWLNKRLQHPK